MGRTWTNNAQLSWLQARCGAFSKAQQTGRLDRFFTSTFDAWFEAFPLTYTDLTLPPGVADLNHDQELQKAKSARKKQVTNWFKWNTRSARATNGAATSADNALLNALNGRNVQEARKRAPQRIEAYVHLFRDKVKAVVDDALVNVPEAQRLHVRRVTVSRMLSEESEDVNEQVNEYIRQWKIDYQNEKNTAMDKASSTPGEFHAALKHLPAYLRTACVAAAEATGWTIFIAAGGPTPFANGALHMQTYHFGAKSEAGNTFEQSYAEYEGSFALPFSRYLKSCYPLSVRKERSLENPIPPSASSTSSVNASIPNSSSSSNSEVPNNEPATENPDNDSTTEDMDVEATTENDDNEFSTEDANNVSVPEVSVRMTPVVERDDAAAPSSPIENAFARMTLPGVQRTLEQPVDSSESQVNRTTANDMLNIDPVLRSLSYSQRDSVLLNQGLEGFVFNSSPARHDPLASAPSLPTRRDPLASAPSLAITPLTLAFSHRGIEHATPSSGSAPAPTNLGVQVPTSVSLDPIPVPSKAATTPQGSGPVSPNLTPIPPNMAIVQAPRPIALNPISIPSTTSAAVIPISSVTTESTPTAAIPTKTATATLMASLLAESPDYTIPLPALPLPRSQANASAPLSELGNLVESTSQPSCEPKSSIEPSAQNSDVGGENRADGRELTAAEKRALTRAKNKANKRPRWEYVVVEDAPAEKCSKLAPESSAGRTLRARSLNLSK